MHAQGHISDFVHEDGPAVRGFKDAQFRGGGPCECAPFIAEQLARNKLFCKTGAIKGHKGPFSSHALLMYRPRDQFFPSAAFTPNQYVAIQRRHLSYHSENVSHRLTDSYHLSHPAARIEQGFQDAIFSKKGLVFEGARAEVPYFFKFQWLGHIMKGAEPNGFDNGLDGRIAGNDDDLGFRGRSFCFLQYLYAIDSLELQIEEHDVIGA